MAELFAGVVGQERAVAELRAASRAPVHAYLLVGPPGTGKRAAALSFAACLLCPQGGCGECRHCRLALAGVHPDLVVLERSGALISVDEARHISRLAARSPMEAARQVLVLVDFHLVDRAAPALLKTIEEPPASTVFVVLADRLAPELSTIASRCVAIELGPLTASHLSSALEAEGVDAESAHRAARSAGGRLDRARMLALDEGWAARHQAWASVPSRLDGTGAVVAGLVEELLAVTEAALEPLARRQQAELESLADSAERRGEGGGGQRRRELQDRHRREQRRARTDELRAGLATLAAAYQARLDPGLSPVPTPAVAASVAAIDRAGRGLVHNPNEALLLQSLLLALSRPGARPSGPNAGRGGRA